MNICIRKYQENVVFSSSMSYTAVYACWIHVCVCVERKAERESERRKEKAHLAETGGLILKHWQAL